MAKLSFGLSSYSRVRGSMVELPVINMFAESAATEEGLTLQSRPGLEWPGTFLGAGPVAALFQKDGVLGGSLFGVSEGQLYRDGAWLGAIDGDGPFFLDGYEDFLFVAGGGSLWGYDGATLAEVTFPDGANVTKVLVGASRAICLRADTETYYWSDPLSDTIDGLSFSSAESQPDRLLDALFIDDTAILFGADTVEYHPNTNDSDLPFQPLEGRVMEVGIRNTGACCSFGPSFAWVTNNHSVCIQDESNVLSNEGLEARIKASSVCRLWTFFLDATEMLALTIDGETQVWSPRSQMWSEFQTAGQANWDPQCFAGDMFGSSINGNLLRFSDDWVDFGGLLERRFRAGLVMNAGTVTLDNLLLRANPGNTSYLSGDYAEPVVEVRSSRNGGKTWGNWRRASLGAQGDYRRTVQWTALGMFGAPGILVEFRITDPVDFRVSDVRANEALTGF